MAEQPPTKRPGKPNELSSVSDVGWLNDLGEDFDSVYSDTVEPASAAAEDFFSPDISMMPSAQSPSAVASLPKIDPSSSEPVATQSVSAISSAAVLADERPVSAPIGNTPIGTAPAIGSGPVPVPSSVASSGIGSGPMQVPVSGPVHTSSTSAPVPDFSAQKEAFREQSQRLALSRAWPALATLISTTLDTAPWAAAQSEARAVLLADLARIYRDRIRDFNAAETQFMRLREIAPGHREALDFLAHRYRERQDWRALFDLRIAAIEATWDPQQRLEWTREAANLATEHLHSSDLAIAAWELLFRLGDAVDAAASALSEAYRGARKWDRLANFLTKRAALLEGTAQIVVLRELAEVYLSGLNAHEQAAEVLDRILALRPNDPIARLAKARVLARRQDWSGFAQIGIKALDGADQTIQLDVRRLIADALRGVGELERAAALYDLILKDAPKESEAWKGKEEYLVGHNKLVELVDFLSQRAELAERDGERMAFLERAALIAERQLQDVRLAISLQERRTALGASRADALAALVGLYAEAQDNEGLRSALERQLALTGSPQIRIELLRRLGAHCAHRLNDGVRAEACWLQILSAVPDDREVREELTALYRKRGDFEAVDRALTSQAWRPVDDFGLLFIWRAAAANIQENIADSERAIAAWRRVLDLAPRDGTALQALIPHYRQLGKRRELIAALEAALPAAISPEQRIESGLEIAQLWGAEGDRIAAIAALERVLCWSPTCEPALQALGQLRIDEPGGMRGVIDVALSVLGQDASEAVQNRILELVDSSDALGRFFALRRLLHRTGPAPMLIAQLGQAAVQAGAFDELAAVYSDLAASASDSEVRIAHLRELARLYEEKLHDPVRAFLTLSAARQAQVTDLGEIEPLLKLAEITGRFEDALALLEIAASAAAPLELRRAAISRRLNLCETRLNSAERAFHEAVRLLRIEPHDRSALEEVRRLAAAAKLWRSLDALYAELWDRAESLAERIAIARARHALAVDELHDPLAALDQLLVLYRLDPLQPGLEDQLLGEAERQSAWRRVLPVIEARVRAFGGTAEELRRIARLHEERCQDRARAFDLYSEAMVLAPDSIEVEARLEALSAPALGPTLAAILRASAARAADPARMLALFEQVAELYGVLGRADLALDVHQRIIQLQPTTIHSLRVVIVSRRERGLFRELRDALVQLLEAAPDAPVADRLATELEIARLSSEKLDDPETALTTYARILNADPQNTDALLGVHSLTAGSIPPALELRRLHIELQRATGPARVELQLACARLQKDELDDVEGALNTLRGLVAESGADGPGFEPLVALLTAQGAFGELVELYEARAAAPSCASTKDEYLERAVALAEEHAKVVGDVRRERLYRQLLLLRPSDEDLRWRLLRLLRDGERYAELADELDRVITLPGHDDTAEQTHRFLENELIRVLEHRLNRVADAEALLTAQIQRWPQDSGPLLGLASLKLRKGDLAGYTALRERHAKLLPPPLGALVLCHLAEACDDQGGSAEQILSYYRAARGLDAECRPAVEGMKALGRRIKGWRSAAALLPDGDERELGFEGRATRLRQKGEAAEADARQAIGWFERAVAIRPDDYTAWDALAQAQTRLGDSTSALAARQSALSAFARVTPPGPQTVNAHAARIEALAQAMQEVGDSAASDRLFERAHALAPTLPKAALSVAKKRHAEGKLAAAYALYDRVLHGAVELSQADKLQATYQRGLLAAQKGKTEQAVADLRQGLSIDPLHPGLLYALADVLAQIGRPVAAAQHYEQALLVTAQPESRGFLYARLARLWDDRLKQPEEAGVCYDLAVRAGVEDIELMMRALSYYRRSGQHERAAAIIDELLRRTTLAADLAVLWTERAHLALLRDEAQAMEAFDMALSYDPTHQPALDGLLRLLEKRGEWQQVMDILESRADSSAPRDKARALRHLARIAESQLGDTKRAEGYLRTVITLDPERDDYQHLMTLIGDAPEAQKTRQELIASLVALGEPCMPWLIDSGQRMVAAGHRRYAWVLLSPLLSVVYNDQGLKATVLGLRKEFEKAELPAVVNADSHRQVLAAPLSRGLFEVLGRIDQAAILPRHGAEALGSGRTTRLDQKTAVGKSFAAMADRLGLEQAQLTRVDELSEAFRLLGDEFPHAAVRSDVLLTLSPSEFQSLFALVLELSRPGMRLFMVDGAADWRRLAAVLLAAAGRTSEIGLTDAERDLSNRVVALLGQEGCRALTAALKLLPGDADAVAKRLHDAVYETAWRIALLVSGDLRQAARLQTRLDETLPKMPSAGKLEDLSEFFAAAAPLRNLVAFALSPTCAALFDETSSPKS